MTQQRHHTLPVEVPPANRFTVMVIDDLPANRTLLSKVLQGSGYNVLDASNGIEALDMLMSKGVRPDLIITDVEMPVMDGVTMVQQIRLLENTVAGVPIITASGNPDVEMERQAIEAGSDSFLTKPFDLRLLRREIASLLRTRASRSKLSGKRESQDANRLRARAEKIA